jgi:uncharacterized protein
MDFFTNRLPAMGFDWSILQSVLSELDPHTLIGLSVISVVGWFISTLSGGGSSLLIMPFVGLFLGGKSIAPVTTIGAILGNGERMIAYRQYVKWEVVFWEMPGALVGSFAGAYVLTQISVRFVNLTVGIFLLGSALIFLLKSLYPQDTSGFQLKFDKAWYFLPAGILYGFLSGVIGSLGPVLVPFYIGYGLEKQELLGTQATTRMVIHITKVFAYTLFGVLNGSHLIYGLLMGITALPGNWLGHHVLMRISEQTFRRIVMFFVLVSGLFMSGQNLGI